MASYLGLIPREESSGGRQKLGAISKQGNRMLRSLLVEAAQTAVRCERVRFFLVLDLDTDFVYPALDFLRSFMR